MTTALGIESTAWNFSAAVATEGEVLSLTSDPYRPETGGIHPREASRHHSDTAADTVHRALDESPVAPEDLDLVAFARGPGMGPSLRVGATAARALAARLDLPCVGVNHCLAHVHAGLVDTDAEAPVVLNVSGANTQVLVARGDRYRVFGETLDIGLGNALDKLARDADLSHPGGPKIEDYARESDELLDLPYGVKGMNLAFSGLVTAAATKLDRGRGLPAVANSFQETAFAMATEVAERAVAHTAADELLVVGGVANNERLRDTLDTMCRERGASLHRPRRELLGDNGAMIALTGAAMHRHGVESRVTVDQGYRVDRAPAPWIEEPDAERDAESPRGAEAVVTLGDTAEKTRVEKGYRHPDLDRRLRRSRTRKEAKALRDARRAGVPTPIVLDLRRDALETERVEGTVLRDDPDPDSLETYVHHLASLHDAGMTHGDPTTSNALKTEDGLVLIDFGMARYVETPEPKAVDFHLLLTCLGATGGADEETINALRETYRESSRAGDETLERLSDLETRGRYL